MYTITWFIGDFEHSACTATPAAAWAIYWYFRQFAEQQYGAAWIQISRNGVYLDPTQGGHLPPTDKYKIVLKSA